MRVDHMFEDMIHGDDVVSPDVIGQVSRLEGAFEDVITPSPPFRRHVRLDLDACAFQVEESSELIEVSAVARTHVEQPAGRALDQSTVEPRPRSRPELHEKPGDTTVGFVVGVVVARVKRGELRFEGAWCEKLRSAIAALLHGEVAGWNDKIFQVSDVSPVQRGTVRAADRTANRVALALWGRMKRCLRARRRLHTLVLYSIIC